MNERIRIESPQTPDHVRTERKLSRAIMLGGSGTLLVIGGFNALSSDSEAKSSDELTCSIEVSQAGDSQWDVAELASPKDADDGHVFETQDDIASNNKLTRTEHLPAGKVLELTPEQCAFVVENDGTVTPLDN